MFIGGPNSFIFVQFSVNILQNNRLPHLSWESAPPLENPGSAADFEYCPLLPRFETRITVQSPGLKNCQKYFLSYSPTVYLLLGFSQIFQ